MSRKSWHRGRSGMFHQRTYYRRGRFLIERQNGVSGPWTLFDAPLGNDGSPMYQVALERADRIADVKAAADRIEPTLRPVARCPSCRTEDRIERGESVDVSERNRAMMWGCTCNPEAEADALHYFDVITR